MFTKVVIWVALTLSIATSGLAVWVFSALIKGHVIVGDSANTLELGMAIGILLIVVVAWISYIVWMVKEATGSH